MNISTIGVGIVVGMALIYDTSGTLKLVSVAAGTIGATWIVKKTISSISPNASQVIDLAGWSIAGLSLIGITRNAMRSVAEIQMVVSQIGLAFSKISEFVDKIVFWN